MIKYGLNNFRNIFIILFLLLYTHVLCNWCKKSRKNRLDRHGYSNN